MAFAYVTLGFLGFRIGRTKHEELFGLIGLKPRAAGKPEKVFVVDTSALIDGRILDLVATGFLSGDLLIHTEVLRELQTIADSSDPRRRARGRRGLDAVVELKRAATVEVHLVEEDGGSDVDAAARPAWRGSAARRSSPPTTTSRRWPRPSGSRSRG